MAHEHDHDAPSDAESELQLALELIDGADYAHAAIHLGEPARHTPHDARLRAAVERLCNEVEDPLALVELGEEPYLGLVVLRGMIAARCGRLDEALGLLLRCEGYAPEGGYLDLWNAVPASEASLAAVDADAVAARIARLTLDSDRLGEPLRSATRMRVAAVLDTLLPYHRGSELIAHAAATLFRRVDRVDEAIEIARAFLAQTSSFRVQLALAYALRADHQRDAAIEALHAAQVLAPDEGAVSLDLGDLYGSAGRLEEAVASYRYALDREPGQPWAQASLHYYRWLAHDDPADAEALAQLAQGENARARDLLRLTRSYEDWLPGRPEALLKALQGEHTPVQMAVSSIEAPSAVAVLRTLFPGLPIEMGEADGVDPRVPRRKLERVLWRYRRRGIWPLRTLTQEAEPVRDGRQPEVSRAIAELARTPYSASGWYREAGALVSSLGAAGADAVCAAMVSVAAAPAGFELEDWVFRVQVAAAFVLARLPRGEAELWDLVYGPADWVSSAAIVALAQLAIEQPARREAIGAELSAQLGALPNPIGYMCLTLPAALNLLRIPELAPQLREAALRIRNEDLLD